jgi:hypothetical protein
MGNQLACKATMAIRRIRPVALPTFWRTDDAYSDAFGGLRGNRGNSVSQQFGDGWIDILRLTCELCCAIKALPRGIIPVGHEDLADIGVDLW